MKRVISERGAGHIVAILLVVVVGVVGFAGYKVMQSQDKKQSVTSSTQQKVDAVPDLKQADTTLNETDKELQTSLDTSALDEDIDAML